MKMTKSMGYNYSMEWWKNNGYENPPIVDPFGFLKKRIEWRYGKGKPNLNHNKIYLADASKKRINIYQKPQSRKYSLLFTSPPYWSITNYHVDQWLRLWLLGGNGCAKTLISENKVRFLSKQNYVTLLDDVFKASSKLVKRNSVVYVRTDAREFTFNTTKEILLKHFPNHKQLIKRRQFESKTQTELFGDKSKIPGEVVHNNY